MADKELQPGEKVEWNSASGPVVGTVEKKLTKPTTIKSHKVAASEENPEYLVHSDKTGARAAHKPEALTSLDRPDEVEPSKKRERDQGDEEKEEEEKRKEKEEKVASAEQADEAEAKEDASPKNKKAKLDDKEEPNKAAQAPEEEIRQEQAAANE
jgi:hypothetical protein